MIQKTTGAPAEDAMVTIDGQQYSLRFSFVAQYEADRLRLNLRDFINGLQSRSVGTVTGFVALLAAMLAHNFIEIGQPAPEPQYWVGKLDRMTKQARSDVFTRVADVMGQWLKEQVPAEVRLQEPAPTQGPTLN